MRSTNVSLLYGLLLVSIFFSCYIFISGGSDQVLVPDTNIRDNQSQAKNDSDFGVIEGTIQFIGIECPPFGKKEVPPCSGEFPNLTITTYTDDNDKKVVIATRTDLNGSYQINLKPGNYIMYASLESPNRLDITRANIYQHITIHRNEKISMNFDIDTKIR